MPALFERALGDAWEDLHPRIRDRYGVVTDDERDVVADGTMRHLVASYLAYPVLLLGTLDDFLFPARGTDVPFRMTTEAFVDDAGNEALFLERVFEADPRRTFVDTLRWNPSRGCITDLFGRRGYVAADLFLDVTDDALTLTLGEQWIRLGDRYVALPAPLGVDVTLRDSYDEQFQVAAEITNPLVGEIFAYRGSFENEFREIDPGTSTSSRLARAELPGDGA